MTTAIHSTSSPAIASDHSGASLWSRLLSTRPDWSTTLLRVVLGIVIFPHAAQKLLGWFGGYGYAGTMGFFTHQLHIPAVFAFLAIANEVAGALGLLSGLLTRVAAFGIAANMVVAVVLIHSKVGFLMNWAGQYPAGQEGFEYHLLVLAIAVYLMIRGGGKASLDSKLA